MYFVCKLWRVVIRVVLVIVVAVRRYLRSPHSSYVVGVVIYLAVVIAR
jgi:hypothetical protein